MAAPNILSLATVTGKTALVDLTSTNATTLVANASSSNQVLKINSVIVSNVDGTTAANIDISIQRSATDYYIARSIEVAVDSSLVVISRETPIYLEEGDTLRATASAADDLEVIVSYEIIE